MGCSNCTEWRVVNMHCVHDFLFLAMQIVPEVRQQVGSHASPCPCANAHWGDSNARRKVHHLIAFISWLFYQPAGLLDVAASLKQLGEECLTCLVVLARKPCEGCRRPTPPERAHPTLQIVLELHDANSGRVAVEMANQSEP